MNDLKIGVLGGGSWGTTVGSLTAQNAETLLWARDSEAVEQINTANRNDKYLPDAELHPQLRATQSISATVEHADVVVMAIPSHHFREVLEIARPNIRPWVPIISLSKGLENGTLLRMTEIIEATMPGHPPGVLTGPNLAREIIAGQAAASVIAMEDEIIARVLQRVFSSGRFRVYTNDDVIGCEAGGSLKNIIALAAGMGDGAGAGHNTQAAIITRGLAELTRLGVAMGGKPATFAGLAGMGDLVATCMSPLSRNRSVGFQLGLGRNLDEIIAEMSMVAEGVKTINAVMELGERYDIDLPIAREVYGVLYEARTVRQAFEGLMSYGSRSEADPG